MYQPQDFHGGTMLILENSNLRRSEPIKLLVTSVGSLVGQNILDVLDYPPFSRRAMVTVIGTNSVATNPNNFRCNRTHLVPPTASADFGALMAEIIRLEAPDVILCGRDDDTVALTEILAQMPGCASKLPYGSKASVLVGHDKRLTWHFCRKHQLPFAQTYVADDDPAFDRFEAFAANVGYPLVAKPACGSASRGVFFVRNRAEADAVKALGNYIFQEYLGRPSELSSYFALLATAPPLFANAPDACHHSCHTFIYADGSLDQIFVSRNVHQAGVTMGFERTTHPVLEDMTTHFAHALYREGGFGPITVQFRQDRHGDWKAMEINLRTNGNTYPRFLMGQDDVGNVINALCQELGFPRYSPVICSTDFLVSKHLATEMIAKSKIQDLQRHLRHDEVEDRSNHQTLCQTPMS
jgi:hypothetical protein